MRKILYFTSIAIFLSSCSATKGLYSWSNYENATYSYLKKEDEKSIEGVIEEYTKIIGEKKKGLRGIPPPGIHADYGFFLMKQGNIKDAKLNLKKEISIYPESKIFIDRILKMME